MGYKFICQKLNGEIMLDFVLGLVHSVEYNNWYNNTNDNNIAYVESLDELDNIKVNTKTIPIGTVEFVEGFYKKYHNITSIKPVGIPEELLEYTKRNIWYGDETEEIKGKVFCKSIDKVKGFTDIIDKDTVLEIGNYMFSDIVEIESEWRCFIHRGVLLGVHNYVNSLSHYPDVELIKEMISKYDNLESYTLDVGVNDSGTFVIEVHDFYSCGLYGFMDYSKLIHMIIDSHNQRIIDNSEHLNNAKE